MSKFIYLPYQFYPREYQLKTMDAFFNKGYKKFIDVEHRRAGKDKKWLNIMIAAAQQRVGLYLHSFPNLTQAKKAIWKGIDKDGRRFLDHIPRQLIRSINNSEMSITFKNGSIYRLAGADYYDSWMGTNPVGIIYSEYSIQDPRAASYFSPILAENGGWQAYVYTPRGKNHGYHLYELNKENPDWFCQLLTVNDTKQLNGVPVISSRIIDEERRSGISEEIIQQEYFVSFDASVEGAYFAEQLRFAEEDNRIIDFIIDPRNPVNTYWDIGTRDKTAIWFIQYNNRLDQYDCLHYYQNHGKDGAHYVNYLHDWRKKHRIVFGEHFGPHDIMKREFTTSQTIKKIMGDLGIDFEVVPRIRHKQDAIEAARMAIPKCRFHRTNCEEGLSALRSYHARRDDTNQVFTEPVHDWSSHAADSFMQFAQTYTSVKTHHGSIILDAVNTTNIL